MNTLPSLYKQLPLSSEYKIDNVVTKSAKYLGVTITQNLSWKEHITKVSNKANSTCEFLQRNLRQCSTDVKSLAYATYVGPIIESTSVVWFPIVDFVSSKTVYHMHCCIHCHQKQAKLLLRQFSYSQVMLWTVLMFLTSAPVHNPATFFKDRCVSFNGKGVKKALKCRMVGKKWLQW